MKKIGIITTFFWIGFVSSISFMEAWLKFEAPNITTKLGLGIGKLVFASLNKVEIFLAVILLSSILTLFYQKKHIKFPFLLSIAVLIFAIQSLWVLPSLNERASLIIQDIAVPKSNLHLSFAVLEVLKIGLLAIFGIQLLNDYQKENDNN